MKLSYPAIFMGTDAASGWIIDERERVIMGRERLS